MITNKMADEIFDKLTELLDIEVLELQKYSKTPECGEAEQGMENEYNYHKKKVKILAEIHALIFFSFAFSPAKYKNRRKIRGGD